MLTGTPATLAHISDESGVCIDEIRAGVAGLQKVGRSEMERSRVIGVGGLTMNPTNHTLALSLATIHTWCALDAVGSPVALALDADVSTSCRHCVTTSTTGPSPPQPTGPHST